jgi:hypothetical protein
MTELLWRVEMLKYRLLGMPPLLTKSTAYTAARWSRFDNSKIVAATGIQFSSLEKCIEETALQFLDDVRNGKVC